MDGSPHSKCSVLHAAITSPSSYASSLLFFRSNPGILSSRAVCNIQTLSNQDGFQIASMTADLKHLFWARSRQHCWRAELLGRSGGRWTWTTGSGDSTVLVSDLLSCFNVLRISDSDIHQHPPKTCLLPSPTSFPAVFLTLFLFSWRLKCLSFSLSPTPSPPLFHSFFAGLWKTA